jgi:hypothetical protein
MELLPGEMSKAFHAHRSFEVWDLLLYNWVRGEPNLTCQDVRRLS